jgi:hypothetical protein
MRKRHLWQSGENAIEKEHAFTCELQGILLPETPTVEDEEVVRSLVTDACRDRIRPVRMRADRMRTLCGEALVLQFLHARWTPLRCNSRRQRCGVYRPYPLKDRSFSIALESCIITFKHFALFCTLNSKTFHNNGSGKLVLLDRAIVLEIS